MSMFITKEKPEVDTDGLIKENVQIAKGVLTIARKEGDLSYIDGKWYVLGVDKKWYYLGLGANPAYETDDTGIKDRSLFDKVFEPVTPEA